MGREKTILLGLLGLLAGVFVGALSLKLLSARPPTGTGPDIRAEVAAITPQERVDPPAPSPGGWDFAAAPPLVPDAQATATADTPADTTDVSAAEPPRFGRSATPTPRPWPVEPDATGGVTPASWQRAEPQADLAAPERVPPARDPFVAAAPPARVVAGDYLVQDGDSWWGVAERAYGDGRLYRALFAWNRARDARVTLAPGTRLDVPPLPRLQAAWPALAAPAARP